VKAALEEHHHHISGEEHLDNEVDDYDIKFDKLISDYHNDKIHDAETNAQRTIPFTKSEFIYSCKLGCDLGENINESGLQNKDLMITMELISKPMTKDMTFETIGNDDVEASLKESKKRKNESQAFNSGRLSMGMPSGNLMIPNMSGPMASNASGPLGEEGDEMKTGFDGNMFKGSAKIMDPTPDKREGVYNESTGTIDSVLFSIWDVSSNDLRYKRIISYQIPHPPIDTDKKCYVSHQGDAVYWIGKQEGVGTKNSCLVVFDRFDFDF
jgi:hypothetical protein